MRLLLVEDDEELAQLLAQRLQAAGYETDFLTTAAEALAAVTTTRYAAMVLDLGLPHTTEIRCVVRDGSVSIAGGESNASQKIVGSVVEANAGTHIQLKVRRDEIDQARDRVIARSG